VRNAYLRTITVTRLKTERYPWY